MAENKDYKYVDHYDFNEELLKQAFAEARRIYKERGFMRKMGFGKAPAITTVDMARAWMSEGHPFTCDHSEEVCANALKVLEAGRKSGVPIFHTTTGYIGKQQWDLPRWDEKIPMSALDINSEWLEIDPKLKPRPEEPVIHKKYASNFFGTHLAQTLNFLGVDTVIVMGATSCACVRHTVMDSTGYGLRPLFRRELWATVFRALLSGTCLTWKPSLPTWFRWKRSSNIWKELIPTSIPSMSVHWINR